MTKRNDTFVKKERDFYPTPKKAVEPLLPFLSHGTSFCEPCAGNGALINHLEEAGHMCLAPFDIEPQSPLITQKDVFDLTPEDVELCDLIITNPPFTWKLLFPLASHLISLNKPVFLLLPADQAHNIRFSPLLKDCFAIISIGRVKWFEDTKVGGMDNYAWYGFQNFYGGLPQFYGRIKE